MRAALLMLALAASVAASLPARGQTGEPPAGQEGGSTVYKPPLRGAPGGRVGGASRSASAPRMALPVIELLAPPDHTGVTARPDPTLYFSISRAAQWPVQFTISAPMQPAPVVDVTIPSPNAAGLYAVSTGAYRVRLQPGTVYTWSVSVVLDPRAWSRNIVASATILYDPRGERRVRRAPPLWPPPGCGTTPSPPRSRRATAAALPCLPR